MKCNFYKKQVINNSASVIFGLVKLIIEKAYQEVQDYRLPTHYDWKVFCCAKTK